jgi:DHA1 family bicyclomycin/chloramphenicol resistance-like MFS transporter
MARFAIVLGALSALGPFAIDMYLPAMPAMGKALHATDGQVQASLMSFFAGLACGQLLFGPISDRLGRRLPIYFGLALFVACSVVCALATSIEALVVARLFQGLSASVGFVVGSAVIRDLHTGPEAARLFALRMLVLGVSPVVSPFVGSFAVLLGSWRLIFWIACGIGLFCVLLVLLLLPETNPPERRAELRARRAGNAYLTVISDRRFMAIVLGLALGQGAFFAYLSGSAFVFIETHHLSPFMFSLVFGINAVGLIGGAQITPNLMRRIGPERVILTGAGMQAVAVLVLLAATLSGHESLPVLVAALFVAVTAYGQVGAPSAVLALKDHAERSGTASAVMGSLQIGSGALTSGLVAAFANGTSLPMVAVIAACATASFLVYLVVLGRRLAPKPA